MSAPVLCPHCASPVPVNHFGTTELIPCPECSARLLVRAFPAFVRASLPTFSGERITDTGQAACFYHPHKMAHVPCDACGRFVCALCDVELHGRHLCPSCIETGRRKGSLTTLESRRVLWDNIALTVTLLPIVSVVLWFCSIVAAPAAILLSIIGWRKPRSLAPRWTRLRFSVAIVFSLAVLVGWGVLFYFIANGALNSGTSFLEE